MFIYYMKGWWDMFWMLYNGEVEWSEVDGEFGVELVKLDGEWCSVNGDMCEMWCNGEWMLIGVKWGSSEECSRRKVVVRERSGWDVYSGKWNVVERWMEVGIW